MSILLPLLMTTAGTAPYDGHYVTITPDSDTQLLLPDNPTRIILYVHGAGQDETAPLAEPLNVPLITEILTQRWAVLSHAAHGDNWGNAQSLVDYAEAIAWAKSYTGLTHVDFLAQSMGGLSGLKMFAEDPTIGRWAGIYPVCNLANMYAGGLFHNAIETAYGFTDDADYSTATAGHDPLLLDSELFAGRKMWMDASPDDTAVPKDQNADLLFAKLDGIADITYNETPTGPHGDPSHFLVDEIVNFFRS